MGVQLLPAKVGGRSRVFLINVPPLLVEGREDIGNYKFKFARGIEREGEECLAYVPYRNEVVGLFFIGDCLVLRKRRNVAVTKHIMIFLYQSFGSLCINL